MMLLTLLLALATAEDVRCNLPSGWKVEINCVGGTVEQKVGTGVILSCPKGIKGNTRGIVIEEAEDFLDSQPGAGELAVVSHRLGTGSRTETSFQGYLAFFGAEKSGKGEMQARIENHGTTGINGVVAVTSDAGVVNERKGILTSPEPNGAFTVKFVRAAGKAKVDLIAGRGGESIQDAPFTARAYVLRAVMGNRGALDDPTPFSVTLERFVPRSGAITLSSMTMCTKYGFYVPAPETVAPTPQPTHFPTVAGGDGGCAGECASVPTMKECPEGMVPVDAGKDMCGCPKPAECAVVIDTGSAQTLAPLAVPLMAHLLI